jgi:hypothetical protein
VRSSSPAGFTNRQPLRLLEIRELGKELQPAGVKRCREAFHEETPRVTGMTIVTTRKDTSIRRCYGNQQGNFRTKADPIPQ